MGTEWSKFYKICMIGARTYLEPIEPDSMSYPTVLKFLDQNY